MAKIFYKRIKRGVMALEEVPELWRDKVEKLLEADK